MTADRRLEGAGLAAAVGLVGLAGWMLGGVGWLNGDAAAYAAQALGGDLTQRSTHLGYLALASWLAPRVGDLPLALDWLATGCAALVVVGAAFGARSRGARPGLAALGAAAVMLPLAAHAEVDPLWIALVMWARVLPGPGAALVFGLAVTVSPAALLCAPWAAWGDRERPRWIAAGAVAAVLGLTGWSDVGWWTADRGVLHAPWPRPGRMLQQWGVVLPWALLPLALVSDQREEAEVLTWIPLLLAPPDVPVWAIPGLTLALRAARGGALVARGIPAVLLGIQLTIAGFAAKDRARTVAAEHEVVRGLAAQLGPQDGLVAPFTWGARVAVEATGDPYGLRWRPPGGFLRDQRDPWCGRPLARVAVLPPVQGEIPWLDGAAPEVLAGCED